MAWKSTYNHDKKITKNSSSKGYLDAWKEMEKEYGKLDMPYVADANTAWAEYTENPEQQIPTEVFYKVLDGGNPIRVYREWRALTVKDLSAKTGLAENVIYNMENGNRVGKVNAYSKIADALNVTMDDIVPIDPSE